MAPEPRGDGGRGDISLLKREVSPHAPQRENRGDSEFQHRRGIAIPGPFSGPPIAPLPRNRLASSAAGGASPVSPTPPNDTKGRGCGPSPLDSPPGMDGGALSEAGSAERGAEPIRQLPRKAAAQYQMRGARSLFLWGTAHPAGAWQVSAAWIRTTPVFKQKRRQRRRFCAEHFFFSTVHGAFSF